MWNNEGLALRADRIRHEKTNKLNLVFTAFPDVDTTAMGFPREWEEESVWN